MRDTPAAMCDSGQIGTLFARPRCELHLFARLAAPGLLDMPYLAATDFRALFTLKVASLGYSPTPIGQGE